MSADEERIVAAASKHLYALAMCRYYLRAVVEIGARKILRCGRLRQPLR